MDELLGCEAPVRRAPQRRSDGRRREKHRQWTRLGLGGEITSLFSIDEMVPAAGQGIIAVETLRESDLSLAHINHEPTATAARCERGVLQQFGMQLDCYSPIAVHATLTPQLTIRAFYERPDGRKLRVEKSGDNEEEVILAVYEGLNR